MKQKTPSEFAFLNKFNTEEKAVKFFESYRWKKGRRCPTCGGMKTYEHKSRKFYYHCQDCIVQFSCRNNTIMQSTKMPVKTWLYAMYKVSVARKDASSLQLSKEPGITQKSACFLLQRINEACSHHGMIPNGGVKVDEIYIEGKEADKHSNKKTRKGRGVAGNQAIIGMRTYGERVKQACRQSGYEND